MIHLYGRGQRHPQTLGAGVTWCGKKLLGRPESSEDGVDAFSSYGSQVRVTLEANKGSCELCRKAFDAAYAAAFPEGTKPIASFKLDNPEDVARAKRVLSPTTLNEFFGPGGRGMAGFVEALGGGS